jgi:hypothetical protein
VTLFGILMTPAFLHVIRGLARRRGHEPLGVVRPPDDLQLQAASAEDAPDPRDQGPGVAAVGPELLEAMEPMPDRLQDPPGPVAILDGRRMGDDRHQQPERIDRDVPPAAIDLLARVVAVGPLL